jgi:hypothetical protein
MSRPITIEELTKSIMQTLEDVVTESYPPEERAQASAMLLNALGRSMFQGPEEADEAK